MPASTYVVADGQGKDECAHAGQIAEVEPSTPGQCEDCIREGSRWVHLRVCVSCGHVGCCDSSPRRHATAHWNATSHPVMRSAEPGEQWAWCYQDELMLLPAGG